jgi:hypothetical protein
MTVLIRIAAVAAVVVIAAVVGFQFNNLIDNVADSPSPSASPSLRASVSAEPSASSEPSVPAESLEPSAEPSAAALVVRLLGGSPVGRFHVVTVLEDGRVITSNMTGAGGPALERRITAEGIQLIRSELDATGLTDMAGDYQPVLNPGVEDVAYGGVGPSLEVGQVGGEIVVVTWYLFGDGEGEADYMQPQPEAEVLEALAMRLSTLELWLPASTWADASRAPYEPDTYRVFVRGQSWSGSIEDLPVDSTGVSWSLAGTDGVRDAVEVAAQTTDDGAPSRCRAMGASEAGQVIDALKAAGASGSQGGMIPGTIFQLGSRATSRVIEITFEPILPHADSSCGAEEEF